MCAPPGACKLHLSYFLRTFWEYVNPEKNLPDLDDQQILIISGSENYHTSIRLLLCGKGPIFTICKISILPKQCSGGICFKNPPPAIPKRVQTLCLWTAAQNWYKTNLYFVLYKYGCGGLSDCEELVGVNQTCQNLPLNSLKPLSKHILLS